MKKFFVKNVAFELVYLAKDRDVVNALEDIFYYLANNNERQYNEWREYHREVIAREFPLFAKFL